MSRVGSESKASRLVILVVIVDTSCKGRCTGKLNTVKFCKEYLVLGTGKSKT